MYSMTPIIHITHIIPMRVISWEQQAGIYKAPPPKCDNALQEELPYNMGKYIIER